MELTHNLGPDGAVQPPALALDNRFVTMAKHAEDGTQMMVYHHVWPFEPDTWVRAADEWSGRFTPMSQSELVDVVAGDRTDAQAAVTQSKATRQVAGSR